jgi:phage tail-like protein
MAAGRSACRRHDRLRQGECMPGNDYPPSAFYFKVVFAATADDFDTSFQDVSGIKATIETETYKELGENGFVYQLPRPPTYPNLVLKRGIASKDSPLVQWCKSVFEGDFSEPISTMGLMVYLMNEQNQARCAWDFTDAFPVSWEVDSFNSTKNEVAIETIELRYNSLTRVL